VSVLVNLFVWVVLVLVVPNLSPYVAAQIVRIPSVAALQRDLQYLTSEERDELGRAAQRKVEEKYKLLIRFGDRASEEIKHRVETDPEFRRLYDQFQKEIEAAWGEVNRQQQEKAARLVEGAEARTRSQFQLSKKLSYASPLPPLVYASTELSVTGFDSRDQFDRQAGAYNRALRQYAQARYREEQQKNPAFSWNDFLDLSTRPRFTYVPPPFAERFASALPFVAFLVGWNLLFFTTAIISFLRFDVR
jgi:hypothetical protein